VEGGDVFGSDGVAEWFDAANEQLMDAQGAWTALWRCASAGRQATSAPAGAGTSGRTTAGGGGGAADVSSPAAAGGQPATILSFSHFLPHQRLLPEKRFLSYPPLAKAVGSTYLGRRLERLQPSLHVFGHSHFAWDMTLDGGWWASAKPAATSAAPCMAYHSCATMLNSTRVLFRQQQGPCHHQPPGPS
jgi:hypothetical protein